MTVSSAFFGVFARVLGAALAFSFVSAHAGGTDLVIMGKCGEGYYLVRETVEEKSPQGWTEIRTVGQHLRDAETLERITLDEKYFEEKNTLIKKSRGDMNPIRLEYYRAYNERTSEMIDVQFMRSIYVFTSRIDYAYFIYDDPHYDTETGMYSNPAPAEKGICSSWGEQGPPQGLDERQRLIERMKEADRG